MPLVFKSEPPEVTQVVKTRLDTMSAKKAHRTPRLAEIMLRKAAAPPVPTQPLPVYNMDLADLAENRDQTAATLKSWRFLVKHDDEVVATADALVVPNQKPVFSHINEGPLVSGVVSAIQAANAQDQVIKGQYEARLLIVPALYIAVLWLVDLTGGKDLAIAIEPTPPAFAPNKLVTAEDLIAKLQKMARDAIAAKPDKTMGGS
jgi:hypothetical protein